MNVLIEPVQYDELADIAIMEREIEGENAASLDVLKNRFAMFPDGFLTARLDGRIIGYLESCLWDEEIPSFNSDPKFFGDRHREEGEILYIIFLGVLPQYHRQGVASKIIQALQVLAHQKGDKKIHAVTWDHLQTLYTKQGFKIRCKMPGFLPEGEFQLLQYNS